MAFCFQFMSATSQPRQIVLIIHQISALCLAVCVLMKVLAVDLTQHFLHHQSALPRRYSSSFKHILLSYQVILIGESLTANIIANKPDTYFYFWLRVQHYVFFVFYFQVGKISKDIDDAETWLPIKLLSPYDQKIRPYNDHVIRRTSFLFFYCR